MNENNKISDPKYFIFVVLFFHTQILFDSNFLPGQILFSDPKWHFRLIAKPSLSSNWNLVGLSLALFSQNPPLSLRNPPHSLLNLGKSKEKDWNKFGWEHLGMNDAMKPFVDYCEDIRNFL